MENQENTNNEIDEFDFVKECNDLILKYYEQIKEYKKTIKR